MKRKKRGGAPGEPKTSVKPYPGSAGDASRRWVQTRLREGAMMIFVAEAIVPPVIVMGYSLAMNVSFDYARWVPGLIRGGIALPVAVFSVPLAVLVALAARRLTDGPRGEPISDELRAMTRFTTLVHAVTILLTAVTMMIGDGIGYGFFSQASGVTRCAAETCLALTAARHLAWAGSRGAAMAAGALAAALPAGLVAGWFLTRWTQDAMYNRIAPAREHLAGPLNLALWAGIVVVFGAQWWVLSRTAGEAEAQAT